jgi:hypothetical protein
MSRASETAKGAAITACGRSTAEGLGGGKIWSAASARRPACPAGEIFSPDRLEAEPAGSSPTETCRDGLAEIDGEGGLQGYSPGAHRPRLEHAPDLSGPPFETLTRQATGCPARAGRRQRPNPSIWSAALRAGSGRMAVALKTGESLPEREGGGMRTGGAAVVGNCPRREVRAATAQSPWVRSDR